jgi:hypothetical protein
MNKFIKAIKGLVYILKQPSLLNLVLESESNFKKTLISKYVLTNGLPVIDVLDMFTYFKETVNPYSSLDGTSLITDLALLKKLAVKFNVKNYFEIGTWRGESVSNVSQVVDNCFTLNISDKEMRDSGLDEDYINLHRFFSNNKPNITHLFGNSSKFDFSPYMGKMDMVFIDGNHHYQSVKNDTKVAFDLIKNENSIIVWHDYSSDTVKVRWDVLAGIIDGCPENKKNKLFHVSNTLCAIYFSGDINSSHISSFPKPNKIFNIEISANRLLS